MAEKKHVILDTDIGGDIDDHWALGMLLNIPEAEIELVLTSSGNTAYRAKVAAQFLEKAGRTDVKIGIGKNMPSQQAPETFAADVADYSLNDYPGTVIEDGIAEMIRIIEANPETAIIGIGPMTNLAELCNRRPDLLKKCRLALMGGSIAKNYKDRPGTVSEYNVAADTPASKTVFSSDWKEFTITPLDSCGNMFVDGELYRRLYNSRQPIPREIIASYKKWLDRWHSIEQFEAESSILYDTVAVHLAFTGRYVIFDNLNLIVDDKGFLRNAPSGKPVRVAMDWSNVQQFKADLVDIITREESN